MASNNQRMSSQHERGTMKKIVFYCPEMERMAREVQASDPGAAFFLFKLHAQKFSLSLLSFEKLSMKA